LLSLPPPASFGRYHSEHDLEKLKLAGVREEQVGLGRREFVGTELGERLGVAVAIGFGTDATAPCKPVRAAWDRDGLGTQGYTKIGFGEHGPDGTIGH
jgi:hypothetical protein